MQRLLKKEADSRSEGSFHHLPVQSFVVVGAVMGGRYFGGGILGKLLVHGTEQCLIDFPLIGRINVNRGVSQNISNCPGRVVMTGQPMAFASKGGQPKPSTKEGKTKARA